MNPLHSLRDYEQFIYTLPQRHASIQRSTLTVIRRGADVARLIGDVELAGGYRLVVRLTTSTLLLTSSITASLRLSFLLRAPISLH